jgi:hypothetical protein
MNDKKLMTLTEYAAHRGISHPSLIEAVNKGRISYCVDEKGRKWFDQVQADEEWEKTTRRHGKSSAIMQRKNQTPLFPEETPATKETPEAVSIWEEVEASPENRPKQVEPPSPTIIEQKSSTLPQSDYFESKARREKALAELAEMESQEKAGLLVYRSAIKKLISEKNSAVLKNLQTMVLRIQGELAAESDPFKVGEILDREIILALKNLPSETNDV